MPCELTAHAEKRLSLRIHELRSSGVCINDFEQEIIKAVNRACNGDYTKAREGQHDQYILCTGLGRCTGVMIIIVYTRIKYDGETTRIITIIPTTKERTIKRYCVDPIGNAQGLAINH